MSQIISGLGGQSLYGGLNGINSSSAIISNTQFNNPLESTVDYSALIRVLVTILQQLLSQSSDNTTRPTPTVADTSNNSQPFNRSNNFNTASNNNLLSAASNQNSEDDRNIDFNILSATQRDQLGMTPRERAILHLWGRQVISAGKQDGGIYTNVLGADGTGTNWANKAEVELVKELRAAEKQQFGGDTGIFLDQLYFNLVKEKTGVDMSTRYANRPVHFSSGAVSIITDINLLHQRTGLTEFEQGALRLFGHDPLINGKFDGSVLDYTISNNNALDGSRNSSGNPIDKVVRQLLNEDIQDDGQRNGSSLMKSVITILDRLYSSN
ncbi:MAG: hypothetical protein WAQ53_00105 [Thiofilum sp.]|uniref:hypothetical protein n=1 Tax=Thiofilum sp. TaxID=2212733 RepID=UPI0025D06FA2|nr:hypothetical protein [Thiofilum sp.]MBK8452166.1 hypothetical protein [Thiofilum sp.]